MGGRPFGLSRVFLSKQKEVERAVLEKETRGFAERYALRLTGVILK
jgi:hypothetical protein